MRRANTYPFEINAISDLGPRGAVADDLAVLAQMLD
jgi:hypothetical protein